jgi:hypothetical protein
MRGHFVRHRPFEIVLINQPPNADVLISRILLGNERNGGGGRAKDL